MKRTALIITLTVMLCLFASCGHDSAEEVPEESSVTSVADETEDSAEETTEEITEEEISETEYETEVSTDIQRDSTDTLQEIVEKYLECINNADFDGMLKFTYPDKYIDVVKTMTDKVSNDDIMSNLGLVKNLSLVSINSQEPIPVGYTSQFSQMLGMFEPLRIYVENTGIENIDTEKFYQIMQEAENTPQKAYFEVNNAFIVNCTISGVDNSGAEVTDDREYILYYIDGEGWKLDFTATFYIYNAEQESADTAIYSTYTAINTALADIEIRKNITLPETGIISSDSSRNYNMSDDYISMVEDTLYEYYPDGQNIEYFAVIKDGVCVYTAGYDTESPDFIGICPPNSVYSADGEMVYLYDKTTYDELYQMCLDEIETQ